MVNRWDGIKAVVSCLAISALFALTACDDKTAERQQAEAALKQTNAKDSAEREAKRAEEQRLMASPAEAIPELERRLSSWISTNDGMLLVKEATPTTFDLFALSPRTPWVVNCRSRGIEVVVGSWTDIGWDGDSAGSSDRFSKVLTRARLTQDECNPLLAALVRHMDQLTNAPR